MEFCSCREPKINKTEHAEPYCEKCGFWWDPKYGSRTPGQPLPECRMPNNQPGKVYIETPKPSRSKYAPHVGNKQLRKQMAKGLCCIQETASRPPQSFNAFVNALTADVAKNMGISTA